MIIRAELNKKTGATYWCVDAGRIEGRRIRRHFRTREKAELWAQENRFLRKVEGRKTMGLWAAMTLHERGSLVRALELLRPEVVFDQFRGDRTGLSD